MEIQFAGFTFRFDVLTTGNRYQPAPFTITSTPGGLSARSTGYTFGSGCGKTTGAFEVTFSGNENEFSWRASAEHHEPIKGIRVTISPFPVGMVRIPMDEALELKDGQPGRVFVYPGGYYPLRHVSSTDVRPHSGPLPIWASQFAIFEGGEKRLFLSTREYPPRTKKMWIYRKGDRQEVVLYSEADACRRSERYEASAWRLETVDDWHAAVADYAQWMKGAFGIAPFAERPELQPWMKKINLVVVMSGMAHDGFVGFNFHQVAGCLKELAQLHPPEQILVKLDGFEGRIDRVWPWVDPAPELGGDAAFDALIEQAHRLGYHLMPHLNVWGASYENPATQALLAHQIIDPEGQPSYWSYDYDQDEMAEAIMAYISPDAPEWRAIQVERIGKLVARGIDAFYLDQTGTFINDLRHDHFRGLQTLYRELHVAYPHTQFCAEGPTHEISASLSPVLCGLSTEGSDETVEMFRILFGDIMREYAYNQPPEKYRSVWGGHMVTDRWSPEDFIQYEQLAERAGAIPSLNLTDHRIRLDGELVKRALERAKRYQMI